MKLLFYSWEGINDRVTLEQLKLRKDLEITVYNRRVSDYHSDSQFSVEFINLIHQNGIEIVFSYDYIPLISMICEINSIPYVSWILDCPMTTTCSKTISNECNFIFSFDRLQAQRISERGAKHCFHMPLGGYSFFDGDEALRRDERSRFAHDISFVGSLYIDDKNSLSGARFDDFTQGFVDGVIEAQKKVYGYNFIREALTPEIITSVAKTCGLELGEMFEFEPGELVASAIGSEVTSRERQEVLDVLSNVFDVYLYTKSKLPDKLNKPKLHNMGTVDYEKQMPYLFRDSRINLNITSKTIESGIPLRVLDILFCGGFCLTNYQPEIAEYFEDGVDLVMYTSIKDMVTKAAYYLEHEQERLAIARNGYQKAKKDFALDSTLDRVFSIVKEELNS